MKNVALSGNQLKLIALISMTLDHVGLMLLPQYTLLRVVGRLAFPIYAYMIAEGCRYTRSMGKYFATLLLSAAGCQLVYLVFMGSLYMCILVTFSLSIGLVWLLEMHRKRQTIAMKRTVIAAFALVFFVAEVLPRLLPGTDFGIDYGFVGILLPVAVYLLPQQKQKLFAMGLGLLALSVGWKTQLWSLLALPLLALYSGKRGKGNLKWLFYIYYPAHLVVIWLFSILL